MNNDDTMASLVAMVTSGDTTEGHKIKRFSRKNFVHDVTKKAIIADRKEIVMDNSHLTIPAKEGSFFLIKNAPIVKTT